MNRAKENARLLERAAAGERAAEEELMRENMALVRSIALRFVGRGQDLEDLVQIGSIGMLKAVRGYDKSYGTAFSTYAVPLISGEIKRFLRDDGLIKVSREAKRHYSLLMHAKEAYIRANGKEPRLHELCEQCGVSEDDAVYAMEACGGTVSLQEKLGDEDGLSLEDVCGDSGLGELTDKIALRQAIETLGERDKTIVYMRYYKGLTQNEVAVRLGLTQVKVSRAEKKIKETIRNMLLCG